MKPIKKGAICYAITANEKYAKQALISLKSLRQHNQSVKIYFFIYGSLSEKILKSLRKYNVIISKKSALPKGLYPYMVKWLALNCMQEDQVLFLDTDTIISGDIEHLFRRYRRFDFYARQETATQKKSYRIGTKHMPRQINHKVLNEIYDREGFAKIPIFNAGIMLFNRKTHRQTAFQKINRELTRLVTGVVPYPCTNPHIRGEIALALTLSKMKDFSWGFLSKKMAPFFLEVREKDVKKQGLIMHVLTAHYDEFLNSPYYRPA
jgi:hypothetical protein